MIGIYQILNTINNKRYIGSSVMVERRLQLHKNRLDRNRHENSYLQYAWKQYGAEAFEFTKILECRKEDLHFYEDLIITGYRANERSLGYNLRVVSGSNAGMIIDSGKYKPGDTYNRLTFIKLLAKGPKLHKWLARCSCGNEISVTPSDVKTGHTKSCGCLNKQQRTERINKWNKANPEIIQERMNKIHEDFPEPWNKKKENI